MKKRIRKKKHLGEFDFKGFDVECKFKEPISPEKSEEITDALISFVELNHLRIGGGGNAETMGFFVTKVAPGRRRRNGKLRCKHVDCSSADQEIVKNWFESREEVATVTVTKLVGCTTGK